MGDAETQERADPRQDDREALRRCAEAVGARAELLSEKDRALMQSVFVEGKSLQSMARLLGCDARSVRRRIARLEQRVKSPKFLFVSSHLSRMGPGRRRVAVACVLHGMSLRAAAAALGTPIHAVRRHADAVHAMFEAAGRRGETAGQRSSETVSQRDRGEA